MTGCIDLPAASSIWKMQPCNVDLWVADLDAITQGRAFALPSLSKDEVARAGRFRFERDRNRYIAARSWLRAVLADYVSAPPSSMRFTYNMYGKPELAGPSPIRFNLSHTGSLAALAVCRDMEVGIDIEAVRDFDETSLHRYFSRAENAALDALPAHERRAAFYRCWTRKEAMIKAEGRGLSMPLGDFDVSLDSDETARLLRWKGDPQASARWTLIPFAPANGVAGAIAVRSNGAFLSLRRRRYSAGEPQAFLRASMT